MAADRPDSKLARMLAVSKSSMAPSEEVCGLSGRDATLRGMLFATQKVVTTLNACR